MTKAGTAQEDKKKEMAEGERRAGRRRDLKTEVDEMESLIIHK